MAKLKIEQWKKYPVRVCQGVHKCDFCTVDIQDGQEYYDGGRHKAHVHCLIRTYSQQTGIFPVPMTVKEVNVLRDLLHNVFAHSPVPDIIAVERGAEELQHTLFVLGRLQETIDAHAKLAGLLPLLEPYKSQHGTKSPADIWYERLLEGVR